MFQGALATTILAGNGDGSPAVEPLEVIFTGSKNPLLLVPCVYSDRKLSNASF